MLAMELGGGPGSAAAGVPSSSEATRPVTDASARDVRANRMGVLRMGEGVILLPESNGVRCRSQVHLGQPLLGGKGTGWQMRMRKVIRHPLGMLVVGNGDPMQPSEQDDLPVEVVGLDRPGAPGQALP